MYAITCIKTFTFTNFEKQIKVLCNLRDTLFKKLNSYDKRWDHLIIAQQHTL